MSETKEESQVYKQALHKLYSNMAQASPSMFPNSDIHKYTHVDELMFKNG